MRTLAIAGVGLIGGSFALAARKSGWNGPILGVSSPRTVAQAMEAGVIDEGVTLEEAAARADILYLAQPISVILDTIDRLGSIARPGCFITDAGSTKAEIVRRAAGLRPGAQFVGGHPMAGKEARGVTAADPELFRGRTYVLTPRHPSDLATPEGRVFIELIEAFGALHIVLSAEEHDRVVAFTSHLPQLASTALACAIGSQLPEKTQLTASGPGLRDQLRLALSSWDIWRDIVGTNTVSIDHALKVYIDKLTEIRENLRTLQLGEEFSFAADVAGTVRRSGEAAPPERGEAP